jgi:ATP-dependent RNA helicase RhlE
VHRIGRTARAGTTGTAISFCDETEGKLLKLIEKTIKFNIPVLKVPELLKLAPIVEETQERKVAAKKKTNNAFQKSQTKKHRSSRLGKNRK